MPSSPGQLREHRPRLEAAFHEGDERVRDVAVAAPELRDESLQVVQRRARPVRRRPVTVIWAQRIIRIWELACWDGALRHPENQDYKDSKARTKDALQADATARSVKFAAFRARST